MPLPPGLSAGFAALALAMAVLFVASVWLAPVVGEARSDRRRAALVAAGVAALYLVVSAALARAGVLAELGRRPPPAGLLLVGLALGMAALAFSRFGTRLLAWPLGALAGVQAFRVLIELLLLAAYHAGSVPREMTFEGHNVDIVTGLLAAGIGVWAWRGTVPRGVVLAWNVLGLGLLVAVVASAATSAFGIVETHPRVTLPATWPGVWLPAWLVQLALLGHLLVFRALARDRRAQPS